MGHVFIKLSVRFHVRTCARAGHRFCLWPGWFLPSFGRTNSSHEGHVGRGVAFPGGKLLGGGIAGRDDSDRFFSDNGPRTTRRFAVRPALPAIRTAKLLGPCAVACAAVALDPD